MNIDRTIKANAFRAGCITGVTPVSRRGHGRDAHDTRGFTLVELLVVIGIIVLLVAILLPALSTARRKAKSAATSATMGAISTALNAYQADFLDYPPAYTNGTQWTDLTGGKDDVGVPGFEALGIWLVGPGRSVTTGTTTTGAPKYVSTNNYKIGDCVTDGTSDYCAITSPVTGGPPGASWLSLSYQYNDLKKEIVTDSHYADGLDGPGMKVGNKQYGPYLQPEHVRMRGGAILDSWDNPIAYFPVHAKNVNVRTQSNGAGGYCSETVWSKYDALDNLPLFVRSFKGETVSGNETTAVQRVQVMLGDTGNGSAGNTTPDGTIDGSETPIDDHPYLLWSAGPDLKFSVQDPASNSTAQELKQCDDIVNFK